MNATNTAYEMHVVLGFILASVFSSPGSAIECYRCNSTSHRECLEKFIQPTTLKPESCSDVTEAKYCIKTTGIFGGEVGDQRFCSARDLGNYCEYIRRDEDDREFRSCVYTCDSNACNSSPSLTTHSPAIAATVMLSIWVVLHRLWSFR